MPEVTFRHSPVVLYKLGSDTWILAAGTLVIAQAKDQGTVSLLKRQPLGAVHTVIVRIARDDEIRDIAMEERGDLPLRGREGPQIRVHGLVRDRVAVAGAAQHGLVDRPVVQVDVCGVGVGVVVREESRRLPHRARVRVLSVRRLQPPVLLPHAAPLHVLRRRVHAGDVLLADLWQKL